VHLPFRTFLLHSPASSDHISYQKLPKLRLLKKITKVVDNEFTLDLILRSKCKENEKLKLIVIPNAPVELETNSLWLYPQ